MGQMQRIMLLYLYNHNTVLFGISQIEISTGDTGGQTLKIHSCQEEYNFCRSFKL